MEKCKNDHITQEVPVKTNNKGWYILFIKSGIPVIGFIYLAFMAIKSKDPNKKAYAKAMVQYKLTIYATGLLLIIAGLWISIPYIQKLLDYMELL